LGGGFPNFRGGIYPPYPRGRKLRLNSEWRPQKNPPLYPSSSRSFFFFFPGSDFWKTRRFDRLCCPCFDPVKQRGGRPKRFPFRRVVEPTPQGGFFFPIFLFLQKRRGENNFSPVPGSAGGEKKKKKKKKPRACGGGLNFPPQNQFSPRGSPGRMGGEFF